jgi:hypothetical protein
MGISTQGHRDQFEAGRVRRLPVLSGRTKRAAAESL